MEAIAKEDNDRFTKAISKYHGPKDFLYNQVSHKDMFAIVTKLQFEKLFPFISNSIRLAWNEADIRSFQRLFTGK